MKRNESEFQTVKISVQNQRDVKSGNLYRCQSNIRAVQIDICRKSALTQTGNFFFYYYRTIENLEEKLRDLEKAFGREVSDNVEVSILQNRQVTLLLKVHIKVVSRYRISSFSLDWFTGREIKSARFDSASLVSGPKLGWVLGYEIKKVEISDELISLI